MFKGWSCLTSKFKWTLRLSHVCILKIEVSTACTSPRLWNQQGPLPLTFSKAVIFVN